MHYQQLPLCSFAPVSWYILYHQLEASITKEHFVKQTYRNRFDIASANGVQTLTIPVVSTMGKPTPFNEVRISSEYNGTKLFQAIRSAYGKSAYFEFVVDDLKAILEGSYTHLYDFNLASFEWAKRFTGTELKAGETSEVSNFKQPWKKREERPVNFHPYLQVFSDRHPFESDLSILDVIMNQGKVSISSLGSVNNS